MMMKWRKCLWVSMVLWIGAMMELNPTKAIMGSMDGQSQSHYRILLDTDVDTDDFFALLYLLKLNSSLFQLKAVTISTNAWTNAGHAVNHIYDILYMMDRDDILVGMGGEGGISHEGIIFPNVGGYLPIIEQGMETTGYCRYRQAIPVGEGGRLTTDTNFGIRKAFLPQGWRRYSPLRQPTTQQVMINVISEGPTVVFLTGTLTNFALFLMSNPHLKKNVDHIYIMGGSVRSPKNSDPGNLFTAYTSNPYAEYNIFGDPFAAYQVIHSGIRITLVPLDATNTIPITKDFFDTFEKNQKTYEAQYCFKSLKMARDTWPNDQFHKSYFSWDSFMVGIAMSIMSNPHNLNGQNDFAEMTYMNITVVTSNEPYGALDGSNPFFDGRNVSKFHLKNDGVHSGHVQKSLQDPFCLVDNNRKGVCKDGYTKEIIGPDGVQVLVATKAKLNEDPNSRLDREFLINFLDVLNRPHESGKFNFTTQFPNLKEVLYKPDYKGKKLGRPVIFDMDMSVGDFLSLFYLLKVPVQLINLKAIFVTPTGWANAATIDVVYDLLHMMGRDDIPVGLGDMLSTNPISCGVGDCKYVKVIPHGSGGSLDSDTLYGLARDLPRSPRRYTAENSMKFGAPRDTDEPELRQLMASEIWDNISTTMIPETKLTILTNGPLTTLAKILISDKSATSIIQDILIVGGSGRFSRLASNKYGEMNIFLDPLAAKIVIESQLPITLIPRSVQKKVASFTSILGRLYLTQNTPELLFVQRLISRLQRLKKQHSIYQHMDIFVGEILGVLLMANDHLALNASFEVKPVKIAHTTSIEDMNGEIIIDEKEGKPVKVLEGINEEACYHLFADRLGDMRQSAVLGSFSEQARMWSTPRRKLTP